MDYFNYFLIKYNLGNIFLFFYYRPGSVVAESVAEYIYTNNETKIQFVNNQLVGVLNAILNNTRNLIKISQAFHNANVQLNAVNFNPPVIKSKCSLCQS